MVIHRPQQHHSNHHQRQHLDYKGGSPKATPSRRKQCTGVVIVRSKILDFHPRERLCSQKQCLQQGHCHVQPIKAKPWVLTMEITTRYSRSIANKEVLKCCYPHLWRLLLQDMYHQARMNLYPVWTGTYPASQVQTTSCEVMFSSHQDHAFVNVWSSINRRHGILYIVKSWCRHACPMVSRKKELRSTPSEAD
jgi:hypothetical protein